MGKSRSTNRGGGRPLGPIGILISDYFSHRTPETGRQPKNLCSGV